MHWPLVLHCHCDPDEQVPHVVPHPLGTGPQLRVPQLGVHPHTPDVPLPPHVFGVVHTWLDPLLPHPPQLLLSVLVFTQPAVPQSVPDEQMHWLFEQVRPPVQSVLEVLLVH
jgi:hypothetical protein